jgi:hypothetical protein
LLEQTSAENRMRQRSECKTIAKNDVEMKIVHRDFFPICFSLTRRCGGPSLSPRMC